MYLLSLNHWVGDCCSTSSEHFFSYFMERTSYISM